MGMELRAGRDRDSGPDRLSRLVRARDEVLPDEPDTGHLDGFDGEVDGEVDGEGAAEIADRWGETAMPDWLDTRRGRQTWTARHSSGFDCLDDEDSDDGRDDEDEWDAPRRRWTMLPPAAIGLILVGLVGVGFAGYSLLKQNEPATPLVAFDEPVGSAAMTRPAAPGAATSQKQSAAEVVVSVVGLVFKPGLVHLPAESRVADALAHAGGARPNADTLSLNLAQVVRDGDQILVGQKGDGQVRSAVVGSGASGSAASGAPGSAGSGDSGGSAGAGRLVNLNTATETELDALPGVGPVTAQAILAWREANGSFASVDQLAEVDGIGDGRLAKLRPLVTVG